jgi:hypothetical protein
MRYFVLAVLIVAGCCHRQPWERELARWYKQQIMWEKYRQVRQAKHKNPRKKVEAVKSEYLESLQKAAHIYSSPINKPSRQLSEREKRIEYWSRYQKPIPQKPPVVHATPRHKIIHRRDLKNGQEYIYSAPGANEYKIRIVYAKYRGTYGIMNIIKWRRVYSNGKLGPLESRKDGVFKSVSATVPHVPKKAEVSPVMSKGLDHVEELF